MATPASLARGVVLPSALAAAALGVLGLFLSQFLRDEATLAVGLVLAWASFTAGRALAHLDRPRGYGLFARHVLTGLAVGFAGIALVRGVFIVGPAPWVLLGGLGFGLTRAHRALLREARADDGRRWLRVFRPKDVQALIVLAVGYATLGLAGHMVLRSILGFVPGGGQILAIVTAVYALHGVRLLLAYAAEERASAEGNAVAWLKANALQAGIVAILLVAYAVFRARLAGAVPFFPLVEFGLGIAVFGFVLAKLRARLRKDGTLLATASEARDHEPVLAEIREPDYDVVARPVVRFIESGLGRDEYAQAVLAPYAPDDPRARSIRAQVLAHREPPRAPALAMEWGFAAGGAMTLGLGAAALSLGLVVFRAPMPYPLLLGLLFVALGTYAQQDVARAHHRPWLALGTAGAGTALLFLDFLLFAAEVSSLAAVPDAVWGIALGIAALMAGIPAWSAYQQHRRLERGVEVDARRLAPALELSRELQRARRRAATMAIAAFAILLPAPWLAGWLAERGILPSGFPAFFDDVLAVALWVVAAFGAAALVRFYGLSRGRPRLLASEKAKRERRLGLHRQVMQSIERS